MRDVITSRATNRAKLHTSMRSSRHIVLRILPLWSTPSEIVLTSGQPWMSSEAVCCSSHMTLNKTENSNELSRTKTYYRCSLNCSISCGHLNQNGSKVARHIHMLSSSLVKMVASHTIGSILMVLSAKRMKSHTLLFSPRWAHYANIPLR